MRKVILAVLVIAIVSFSSIAIYYSSFGEAVQTVTLSQGDRGENVRRVQTLLKQWGYYDGEVDGVFGPKTDEAVKLFQRRNGLTVDGVVGPQTQAALGVNFGGARGGETNYQPSRGGTRDDEVQILARAINGEARGEPYIGQVAVGAVILNRVKSPSFPNTIAGVVYQPGAFTAVADGQINAAMEESSIRAARDALNGWDPSDGALFYWNPAKATSAWIWRVPVTKVIGKHHFGKEAR